MSFEDLSDLNRITEKIIGCAFTVSNSMGTGFLEKVYENSLAHELKKNGLTVEQQKPIQVRYDGVLVGEYFADIVVENKIVVELKAVKSVDEQHLAQCLNYLKATGYRLCLLLNFGQTKVEIKRIIQ